MGNLLNVFDFNVIDKQGILTTIWIVYQGARIITIEYTRGKSGLTNRVNLQEAA